MFLGQIFSLFFNFSLFFKSESRPVEARDRPHLAGLISFLLNRWDANARMQSTHSKDNNQMAVKARLKSRFLDGQHLQKSLDNMSY